MKEAALGQKALAELIGTFILTFVGAGAIISTASSSGPLLLIALAHGLALAVAISITMNISGGHINPAVTLGLLATKRISAGNAFVYVAAQLIGAIFAGWILVSFYPASLGSAAHWGSLSLMSGVSAVQGIVIEAIITFILVVSVFGTAVDERSPRIGGFGVGLTLAFLIMAAGPLTGAAANPARALGPEIASGYFAYWYVYIIGPVIGGIVGALVYETFIMPFKKGRK